MHLPPARSVLALRPRSLLGLVRLQRRVARVPERRGVTRSGASLGWLRYKAILAVTERGPYWPSSIGVLAPDHRPARVALCAAGGCGRLVIWTPYPVNAPLLDFGCLLFGFSAFIPTDECSCCAAMLLRGVLIFAVCFGNSAPRCFFFFSLALSCSSLFQPRPQMGWLCVGAEWSSTTRHVHVSAVLCVLREGERAMGTKNSLGTSLSVVDGWLYLLIFSPPLRPKLRKYPKQKVEGFF
jgi:hypothetical protein